MKASKSINSMWRDSRLSLIYTLSPLHVGTGRALGGVDLPIARDEVTRTPIIPGSALKGVAREAFESHVEDISVADQQRNVIQALFGYSLEDIEQEQSADKEGGDKQSGARATHSAAQLAFTEARLIAYPARSLNYPYVHVSSLSILKRLLRDAKALGQQALFAELNVDALKDSLLYTTKPITDEALVIEDLVYQKDEIHSGDLLRQWAAKLAELLPDSADRAAFAERFLILPEADFQHLMRQSIPVQARTQLTSGKTTDSWWNEDTEKEEKGNLWYEEYLPAECVFASFIGERRQVNWGKDALKPRDTAITVLQSYQHLLELTQIGGNETIGYGLCAWQLHQQEAQDG